MPMNTKKYIFNLDYGNRTEEREFIKDILNNFDNDSLVGCGLFVNNNPYSFECLLYLSFEKDSDRFDEFIKNKYDKKIRIFNYFIDDAFAAFSSRGYNVVSFMDAESVDMVLSGGANGIFGFPCKAVFDSMWRSNLKNYKMKKVFLSHSSKDKFIVDEIFNELQAQEVCVWYDKYEIEPGDSITDKINKGLDESDIGVICISKNFLDTDSGWTKSELNFFVQRRMKKPNKIFIIVNFDVPHDELPPLVQDYRYVDYREKGAIDILVNTIKKRLEC